MPNDSSGTDSSDLWSTVRFWAPGLRNGTSLLTRSNPDRSTSDIDSSRRSVLRNAGTAGALALGSGLVPFTTRVSGEPDTRFVAGATCHDPSPPETCDEVYEEIAQEILRLRDLVNQCNRAREAAIARNTHLSEQGQERWWRDFEAGFPNGIWGGQCRATGSTCGGLYPVPDCSGLEAQLRDTQALLNEPCEDIEPTKEEIDRSIDEQLGALEDVLAELSALKQHLTTGRNIAAAIAAFLAWVSARHKLLYPLFIGSSAWSWAALELEFSLATVNGWIDQVNRRMRELSRCRGQRARNPSIGATGAVQSRRATGDTLIGDPRQLAHGPAPGTDNLLLLQDGPFDVSLEAIDYSYEEVSKFEPWSLTFEPPENQTEATVQALTETGLYLGFAQDDLTVSMRRYALVNDLRTQFQSMHYVPSDLVQSLAETELAQMEAIAHNASASADLVDELVQLQSDVNALWEELEGEPADLSPEETKQQFRQWWDDQRNRDEVFARFMPSERGWDEFQTAVTQGLDEISFEMADLEGVPDEEWYADLRSLSDSYGSLAETVRDYRLIVAEVWLPPPRWTG